MRKDTTIISDLRTFSQKNDAAHAINNYTLINVLTKKRLNLLQRYKRLFEYTTVINGERNPTMVF